MKLYRYLMAAVVMAALFTGCRTRVEPAFNTVNATDGSRT